jgi:hypothetical protein
MGLTAPAWLLGSFAVVVLAVAGYSAVLLAAAAWRRRETELDSDVVHLLMGVAMAGMLVPALAAVPTPAWTTAFTASAAWFAWQEIRVRRGRDAGRWRCPRPLPHLAESLAMVYMLTLPRATGLAALFALFLAGYVAWLGDRFPPAGAAARTTCCCKIAMAVVMGCELIAML